MKSKDKSKKLTTRQKLFKAMEFSFGGVRLSMTDNIKAQVEGCKGIVTYDEECVRLLTDKFILGFTGNSLQITRYDNIMTIVEGFIDSVHYERE